MPIGRFNRNNRDGSLGTEGNNGSARFLQGPSLLNGKLQQFIQSGGESSLPLRGIQGLLQRRGMNFLGGEANQESTGNLNERLNVEAPAQQQNPLDGLKGLFNLLKRR